MSATLQNQASNTVAPSAPPKSEWIASGLDILFKDLLHLACLLCQAKSALLFISGGGLFRLGSSYGWESGEGLSLHWVGGDELRENGGSCASIGDLPQTEPPVHEALGLDETKCSMVALRGRRFGCAGLLCLVDALPWNDREDTVRAIRTVARQIEFCLETQGIDPPTPAVTSHRSTFIEDSTQPPLDSVFWEADVSTREIAFVSSNAERMLGYPIGQWLREPGFRLKRIHPDDQTRAGEFYNALTIADSNQCIEYRMVTADGRVLWLRDSISIKVENGMGLPRLRGVMTDITDRKIMERELVFQKALFQAQSEASAEGILVVAHDSRILNYNRRFTEIWKLDDHVLSQRSDTAALDAVRALLNEPDEFTRRVAHFYSHPDESGYDELELRDGRVLERYTAPIKGPDGINLGRLWQFRDITPQKLNLEALRISEGRFRRIVESNLIGIVFWDAGGRIFYANRAFLRLTGFELHDVLEKEITVAQLTAEEHLNAEERAMKEVLGRGTCRVYEKELVGRDGRQVWVLAGAATLDESGGQCVGFVLDLSEKKRAEAERYRREQQFRALVENSPDVIVRYDRHLRSVYLNPAVETAWGLPRKNCLGRTTHELGFSREHCLLIERKLRNAFETKQENVFEFEYLLHDERKYFLARMVPEMGADGSVETVLCVVSDISEHKRIEDNLAAQNRLLKLAATGVNTDMLLEEMVAIMEGQAPDAICSILLLERNGTRLHHAVAPRLPKEFISIIENAEPGRFNIVNATEDLLGRRITVPDVASDPAWESLRDEFLRFGLKALWSYPILSSLGEMLGLFVVYYQEQRSPHPFHVQLVENISHVAGIALETRRAEESLRESEEFLRQMIVSSRECIVVLDLSGRLLWMNSFGQLLFEIDDLRPYANMLWIDFWKGNNRRAVQMAVFSARQGDIGTFQGAATTRKGNLKWWDVMITPIVNAEGKPYRLLAISRDITEAKKAEDALRESEAQFRGAFENAAVGMGHLDFTGRWMYVNEKLCLILGYSSYELTRMTLLELTHPDDLPGHHCQFESLLRGDVSSYTAEKRWFHKDGSLVWVEKTIALQRPLEGPPLHCIAVVQDVSARKRAEAALHEAQERLRHYADSLEQRVVERTSALAKSNEALESYSYTIAHDLRAPLRAMQGLATALIEDHADTLNAEGLDYARRIAAAASRMDNLVQDLLHYGRLNHSPFPSQGVPLGQMVDRVTNSLEEEIRDRDARIHVERPLPCVWANPVIVELVILNLVSNALKFVMKGRTPEIRVWASVDDAVARISVRDNGIGIDPGHQERIFGVFERLHGVNDYPGTGIGLAIVRKGIERMGGKVGLDSKAGEGSCFWFELPLAKDPR